MIFTLLMAATTLAITWIMAQTPSLASPSTPLGVRVPKAYLSDPAVTSALAGFKVRTWTCGIAATALSLFAWKLRHTFTHGGSRWHVGLFLPTPPHHRR